MESKVKELREIVNGLDEPLRQSFQNMHCGYPEPTLLRFLKAREEDVTKAGKMLVDCLHWRVNNKIDNILAKPILPKEKFDLIRQSQLIGFCGFCKEGRPVFAIGVGNSTFDQASVDKYVQSHIQINEYRDRVILPQSSKKKGSYVGTCVKILDMTGLRLSAFSRLKISTAIATVDDLNYPEKTDTYYIVNAPYVFSACWKAVKPMLQERTKRKVQVLRGNGRDELLQVMDFDTLPSFCKTSNGSSDNDPKLDVFSANHKFHGELYNYIQQKAISSGRTLNSLSSEGSLHINVPTLDEQDQHSETVEVVHAIETLYPALEAAQNSSDQNQRDNLTTKIAGIQVST
jgi:transcriptional regulator of met regulon